MRVLYTGRIEISNVGFCEGRKTAKPGEKFLWARREPTENVTHKWHRAGIEPRLHWWEASALFTALSPLCITISRRLSCFGTWKVFLSLVIERRWPSLPSTQHGLQFLFVRVDSAAALFAPLVTQTCLSLLLSFYYKGVHWNRRLISAIVSETIVKSFVEENRLIMSIFFANRSCSTELVLRCFKICRHKEAGGRIPK